MRFLTAGIIFMFTLAMGMLAWSAAPSLGADAISFSDSPRSDSAAMSLMKRAADSTHITDSIYNAIYKATFPDKVEQVSGGTNWDSINSVHPGYVDSMRNADSVYAVQLRILADSTHSADSTKQAQIMQEKKGKHSHKKQRR